MIRAGLRRAARFFKDDDPEDEPPAMKRYKTVRSYFPKIMPVEDEEWSVPQRVVKATASKVRYIPVTREENLPGTSASSSRFQSTEHPPKLEHDASCLRTTINSSRYMRLNNAQNGSSDGIPCTCSLRNSTKRAEFVTVPKRTQHILEEAPEKRLYRKQYINEPVVAVLNVDDEDDDDDKDCIYIESDEPQRETQKLRRSTSARSNYDEDVVELSDTDYDIVHVKRVASTPKVILDTSKRKVYDRDVSLKSDRFSNIIKPRTYKFFKSKASVNTNKPHLRSLFPTGRIVKSPDRSVGSRLNKLTSHMYTKPTQAVITKSFRLDEKKFFEELIQRTKASLLPKTFYARSQLSLTNLESKSSMLNRSGGEIIDLTEKKYMKFDKLINGNYDKQSSTSKVFDKSDFLTDAKASESFDTIDADVAKFKDDSSSNSSCSLLKYQNQLELQMQNKSVTRSDWLDALSKRYADISLRRENEVKKIEDGVEIEEITELTDEQEAKVKNALRPHPPNEVLIEKFSLSIHRRDIHTLSGLNWLNDEVINFYMNLIMQRSEQNDDLPKVYGMNTFFFPRLMQSGHGGIKRWTRKVDIFAYDLMLIPVHLGVHWCMSIIDFKSKNVKYYDSMGGKNMECCNALLKYLQDERMDKKREKFDTSSWDLECVKDIPQQMNGSDCGMFSCMFAEYRSRNAEITFSQNDMPYFRRKMILEIIEGQLLI